MRLTGLLALLLFVLIVFFAAPAASFAQNSNATASKTESPEANNFAILSNKAHADRSSLSEHPLVASQPLVEHNGDMVLREPSQELSPEASLGDDFSCFTMRSYIMARDDKTSDATHLVRQVKCTPARKFSVKSADDRVVQPAGEKSK